MTHIFIRSMEKSREIIDKEIYIGNLVIKLLKTFGCIDHQ